MIGLRKPRVTSSRDTNLSDRTVASMKLALEQACGSLPHGGDHELRKKIAQKLIGAAASGNMTLSGLTEVARAAFAEETKRSA